MIESQRVNTFVKQLLEKYLSYFQKPIYRVSGPRASFIRCRYAVYSQNVIDCLFNFFSSNLSCTLCLGFYVKFCTLAMYSKQTKHKCLNPPHAQVIDTESLVHAANQGCTYDLIIQSHLQRITAKSCTADPP